MAKVLVLLFLAGVVVCFARQICAQTTEFTFQGSLKDGAAPANANYDFEFALFDALSAGSQIGTTIPKNNVPVTAGIFSVKLDFGSVFPGTGRYLEIRVRLVGQPGITTLAPRQVVNSGPYSVKSLSAASADTVNAGNISGVLGASQGGTGIGPGFPIAGTYLHSNGAGWEAAGIQPGDIPGGSSSYVQNGISPQASSNFNISGAGTANIFNATAQFNIGGNRVLSIAGTDNFFAGVGAGQNTTGQRNTFVGRNAGQTNTTGQDNAFYGQFAGQANTTASFNAFFGSAAGLANLGGTENAFFGNASGRFNTSGTGNSFFGRFSGFSNQSGGANSFVGDLAGWLTTTGGLNTFLGYSAGDTNTTGTQNTLIGANADVASNNLDHATALGADSVVSANNTLVLGRAADAVQIPGSLNVAGSITGTVSNAATANNALNLGGTAANQFVQTNDSRLSDARNPLPNSPSYIQNGNAAQASSNFNVSGTGTANIFNTTQYNILGNRFLGGIGGGSTYVGVNAGPTSTGLHNSFFGASAGLSNVGGLNNSIFGYVAGQANVGSSNSIFGSFAGQANVGDSNSFFGEGAGNSNTNGSGNSFYGYAAGLNNTTGSNNTIMGFQANVASNNLTNATAIGSDAVVSQSNSLVLGNNVNVGIGTTAPVSHLHLNGNSGNFALTFTNSANTAGRRGYRLAFDSDRFSFQSADDAGNFAANQMVINQASGNVGIGTASPNAKLQVAGSIYIQQPNSLIITSPNGACWFITVNNAGALSTISTPCP